MIQGDDFDTPSGEWAPIEIDKSAPEFQAVVSSLDEAVEKIRTDYGYAATQPEERDYVLGGLAALQTQLRGKETVTIPFLRQYAIDPIWRASKTFGRSIVGIAIDVFKMRLKEWLMSVNIHWPFHFL